MIDAVVLAGGVDRGEIAAQAGQRYKSLLEVGGSPIIRRVVAGLRGAAEVARIALVAPEEVQAAVTDEAVDIRVRAGDNFVDNLTRGVEATAPGTDLVLVTTGDLPFLTAEAVNDFVRLSVGRGEPPFGAARSGADITYAVIPRESMERAFPGGRRTYVRLRDGVFTGGNCVVLSRQFVQARGDLIARLYAARKNPLRLASLLGFRFLVGLLFGRLALSGLEARAGRLVAGRVAAIISPHPELGFDIDKLDDLLLARRVAG